jgi:phospholipid/cholesterol/gamma-HCH transport system substrate-binding protein
MEKDKHYFFVGIFVLIAIIAIMGFSIWITSEGKGDFVRYRIRFAESVSGLSVGGQVKFRGVSVGSVESITIDKNDTKLIDVIINVTKDTPVKADTEASLKFQGITGVVFVELAGGTNDTPNLADTVKKGNIPEIKAKSSPLNAIIDRVPELLDQISKGIERINSLVSQDNVNAINDMIASWQQMSSQLSKDLEPLGPILENSNQVSKDLREMTANSKQGVSETVENLNRSSRQLDTLMRDLRKTSRSISNVSETIEDNPSSLIFPGEEKGVSTP